MRILVTGGAGYIGSHVVFELIDEGHEVTILDDLSHCQELNIDRRAKFIKGSTHDGEILDLLLSDGIDAIIHLAAWKAAGESMTNPGKYSHNNIIGTLNLLNKCDQHSVKIFIFSSTAAVYGMPKYVLIDEGHSTEPINYYGETKLQIEKNLKWFSELKGIRFGILRYFNAAGYDIKGRIRGKEINPQNLIPIVMDVASGLRKKMKIYGNDYNTNDGTGVRDYIHVTDLAKAHLKTVEYIEAYDKDILVNLSGANGYSVLDIINKVQEISGKEINFDIIGRRAGDLGSLMAESKLAKKLLDWSPGNSDLNTIITSTWDLYKK